MRVETLKDLFIHKINDLYDAEKQIIQAIPSIRERANSEVLGEALSKHLEETENQVKRLEKIAEVVGFDLGGVECKGMKGLLAEGDETIRNADFDQVLDASIVAATNGIEHYEMAGYISAIELARQLDLDECREWLEKSLKEEEHAAESMKNLLSRGKTDLNWGDKIKEAFGI